MYSWSYHNLCIYINVLLYFLINLVEGLTLGQFNENITISKSSVEQANVTELDASSRYRIYLAASTALGIGETIFIEETTDQESKYIFYKSLKQIHLYLFILIICVD